jgi:hypothetical protein
MVTSRVATFENLAITPKTVFRPIVWARLRTDAGLEDVEVIVIPPR